MGFAGVNPLGYTTIESWARLTETRIEPHEVQALLILDTVIRDPNAFVDKPDPEDRPAPVEVDAWPVRKRPVEFLPEEDD